MRWNHREEREGCQEQYPVPSTQYPVPGRETSIAVQGVSAFGAKLSFVFEEEHLRSSSLYPKEMEYFIAFHSDIQPVSTYWILGTGYWVLFSFH